MVSLVRSLDQNPQSFKPLLYGIFSDTYHISCVRWCTTHRDLESPMELQSPKNHQTHIQNIVQKQSEHRPVGKWSTDALRAKKCNRPKQLLAQLICLSRSLDCIKFICICEMLVGLCISKSSSQQGSVVKSHCLLWKWERRVYESVRGEQRAGRGRKSQLVKYLEFTFSLLQFLPFHWLL